MAMAAAVTATLVSHTSSVRSPARTTVAHLGNLTPQTTLTGWYQSPAPVQLNATASGSLVLDVTVVGKTVHVGEQLGAISAPSLGAALSQAKADESRAKAAVSAARAEIAAQQENDRQAVDRAQQVLAANQADVTAAQVAQQRAAAALASEKVAVQGAPPAATSRLLAPYQQQLATTQETLVTAQGNLRTSQAALASANQVANSDPTVTALAAKLSEAQAAERATASQVQEATDALAAATLTSPINGVLANVLVASGSSVQVGTPILSLEPHQSSTADFQVFVPQLMGAKVAVGDRVSVPGASTGPILYVSTSLSTYEGAQGFLATASVPRKTTSSGATTAPGVPLQVRVERATLHHVVVVPLAAIANPHGRTTIAVRSGKVRRRVPVTVIARSYNQVAVSGLRPGTRVYLASS
jgi:multidrug resistance efflux pump